MPAMKSMIHVVAHEYDDKRIRVALSDGQMWWSVKDVCAILEIEDRKKATADLSGRDLRQGRMWDYDRHKNRTIAVVNECGLMYLTESPQAEGTRLFRAWLRGKLPRVHQAVAQHLAEYELSEWLIRYSTPTSTADVS
jgi:prophage antirepressor-like protein